MLRYQQFSDFSISGKKLESMARATVGFERSNHYRKKWDFSGVYHYRFGGEGELARLAPTHMAVVQAAKKQIPAKLINRILRKSLSWEGSLSTGYRSRASSITNGEITSEPMRNFFFTDLSYTLSNRTYYRNRYFGYQGKGHWMLTVEAQNIFNSNSLTAVQMETTGVLLTEGIRSARQIKVGLTYKFR